MSGNMMRQDDERISRRNSVQREHQRDRVQMGVLALQVMIVALLGIIAAVAVVGG